METKYLIALMGFTQLTCLAQVNPVIADQTNTPVWTGAVALMGDHQAERYSQTFTPTRSPLVAVDLDLLKVAQNRQEDETEIRFRIRDANGHVLGSVSRNSPIAAVGLTRFLFPGNGLTVVPGTTLSMELESDSSLGWRYGADTYAGGYATLQAERGTNRQSDFRFVTYTIAHSGLVFVQSGNVWTMNTDGSNKRPLTILGTVQQVRMSNGVVVFQSQGQLWKTKATGGATPALIPNSDNVVEFDVKPTGDKVVFTISTGQEWNTVLYTMNMDGTGKQAINYSGMHQLYPSWGRNGYIYFGQSVIGNAYSQLLYRIAENGLNNPTLLTTGFSQFPNAGGPGDRVAYLANVDLGSRTIMVMNADGSGQVPVAGAPVGVQTPVAFDYDSNVIYYQLGYDIWKLDVNTGVNTMLTQGTALGTGVDFGKIP